MDSDLTGLDFAWRCAEAGHEVKLYQAPNKDRSPVWDGYGFPGIERVTSYKNHMAWAKNGGIIVNLFNDRVITAELDKWRSFGFPVFGPSVASAKLEWERGVGMKFFEKHGIEVPTYHTFKTLDECIKFSWKAQQPYVFKLMGDEMDKSLSYVSSDPADLVGWLEKKRDSGLKLKGDCILQERIDKICDVGISGWMGKDGFLPRKWNVNFEFKKLLPGEFGPSTGEMGTLTRYVEESELAEKMLIPLEEALLSLGHRGDFDIECGIDSKGQAWPYEASCRFGWPSTQILMSCHTCDPVEWMRDALRGKDTLEVDMRVAMGVIMARPPFPTANDDPQSNVGYPITGIEEVWEHVSPWQMMLSTGPVMKDGAVTKGPVYKTTGDYVCVVTAKGSDVHDAIDKCYASVNQIKFADRIVRNDVGKRLENELPKLHAFGYEEAPEW